MLLRKGQDGGAVPRVKRARRVTGEAGRGATSLEEAVFGHGAGLAALQLPPDTLGVRTWFFVTLFNRVGIQTTQPPTRRRISWRRRAPMRTARV